MQSLDESASKASMNSRSASATLMPAWVKLFGVIYLIAVAIFTVMQVAGGGMGYLDHGEMNGHGPPAEHGEHRP